MAVSEPTKGRGGGAGGQRDLSPWQEQQEPCDAEQCRMCRWDSIPLQTGIPVQPGALQERVWVPMDDKQFPVHLGSRGGTGGWARKVQSLC